MKRILAVSTAVVWSCAAVVANPTTFSNTNLVTINGSSAASPYPSPIIVSNLAGVVSKVSIEIDNLTDTTPVGVNLLLVSPTGARAVILSHCGVSSSASNVTLTLDDAAASPVSSTDPLASGAFQPAEYPPSAAFPAPAPSPGSSNLLATFNGTNPNGPWNLYVADDQTGDTGSIAGWSMTITTAMSFTNSPPATILINDSDSPPTLATPYPSPITVSNLQGVVGKVTVRLLGLAHDFPDTIDMLLVGPQGQNVVLWGEVGGFNTITNVNVTLDDDATQSILNNVPVTSGTYLPSTASTNLFWPSLPTNIVVNQTFTPQLSTFIGANPNGVWTLYVVNDASGASGQIKNGWVLSIAAGSPTPLNLQVIGTNAILAWPATPANLTLQSNTDLSTTNWAVVTLSPSYSAGQNIVTNPLSSGNVFYRLSQ